MSVERGPRDACSLIGTAADLGPRAAVTGTLELLVLQSTPFCNLDCTYCYLPERSSTRRMSRATLEASLDRAFSSPRLGPRLTIVWHAGEPLAIPVSYYLEAFEAIERRRPRNVTVVNSFQTNATLLDDDWCRLIAEHGVQVGVSVDGPAPIHDRYRVTRSGRGTHRRTMEGIELLNKNGIPFHVITVLTRYALDYPDEMFEFYASHGIRHVGFNVEEVENVNRTSSLENAGVEEAFRAFMARFYDLVRCSTDFDLRVREFEAGRTLLTTHDIASDPHSDVLAPFCIVTVDWQGNFTTYSPELLGAKAEAYGDFIVGNVARDSFDAAEASGNFLRMKADIDAGVEMCRRTCPYFRLCGGGAPSNKYFETGTFRSTETLYCRLHRKAVLDVLLDKAEGRLPAGELSQRTVRRDAARVPGGAVVAPHRHFLKAWNPEGRIQINSGIRREGHAFLPVDDWREPDSAERRRLVGNDAGAPALVQIFTIPSHLSQRLLDAGFARLETGPGAEDLAARPLEETAEFLSFLLQCKQPVRFSFDFLLTRKDGRPGSLDGIHLPAGGPQGEFAIVINGGDDRSFLPAGTLAFAEMQQLLEREPTSPPDARRAAATFLERSPAHPLVRIALEPGEGCIVDPAEVVYAPCPAGTCDIGFHVLARACA